MLSETVLQGSKLLSSSTRGFRLLSKSGGYKQGLRDFKAFRMKDPHYFKVGRLSNCRHNGKRLYSEFLTMQATNQHEQPTQKLVRDM